MNFGDLLAEELKNRQKRDGRYSLRSFARDLNVSRTTLSLVINKKRSLSEVNAKKVGKILGFSEDQILQLLRTPTKTATEYKIVDLETFALISNWYHMGILGLAQLQKNKADPTWLADRLGISADEAKEALDRLVRVGLVRIKNKRMHRYNENVTTPSDIPSQFIRDYHRQNLDLVKRSLEREPVSLRDMTSTSFPISKKDLQMAKKFIATFRRKFCKQFENKRGDEVYTLAVQLFPLTCVEGEK